MKHTLNNRDNPNGVTPNPNKLWVNKASGLICRVLSRTDNTNICEFWVLPSGSDIPIPQVAHTLEPLEYKGIDYGGYDINTKQWTKYQFNNVPIIRLFWKDRVMVELENGSSEPVERVYAHQQDLSSNTPTNRHLAIDSLIIDDNLQMRVAMDESVIDDYAFLMSDGVEFPPLIVFEDSKQQYWLVDGFHRYYAYKLNNIKSIPCTVHKGEFFHAKLYALSANSTHGLKRSNEDKRKAVLEALFDPEISLHSNRKIAQYCGVSRRFVDKLRNELLKPSDNHHKENTTTVDNDDIKTPVSYSEDNKSERENLQDGAYKLLNQVQETTPVIDNNNETIRSLQGGEDASPHSPSPLVTPQHTKNKPKPIIDTIQLYKLRDKALKNLKVGQQSKQYKDTKKVFDLFINELLKLYS